MLTQRQMMRTGLRRETTARCAWRSGNGRPGIRMPPIASPSLRQYLDAPLVAPPLGRLDCVPVVSGACALVLSARPAGVHVTLRASGARYNGDQQEGDGLVTSIADFAPAMWAEAGIGPEDMNVVGVYDDYPAMALAQLCDLGFTDAGDLPGFVARRLANRSLPVNTAGGRLACTAEVATAAPGGRTPDSRRAAGRGHRLRHGAAALRHVRQCGGTGKGGRMSLHVFACAACGHRSIPRGCGARPAAMRRRNPWRSSRASCWPGPRYRTARRTAPAGDGARAAARAGPDHQAAARVGGACAPASGWRCRRGVRTASMRLGAGRPDPSGRPASRAIVQRFTQQMLSS